METSFYFLTEPTTKLIIIIFICGIIGGIGNTLRGTKCNWVILSKNMCLGIIASIAVPLFLNLVSSDIVKNIFDEKTEEPIINYFIFSGFCIIASYSSLTFLSTISGKVIQNLKEELKQVKSENETLKETTKILDDKIAAITPENQEATIITKAEQIINKN